MLRRFLASILLAVSVMGAFLGCEKRTSSSSQDGLAADANAAPAQEKQTFTVERGTVTKYIQFNSQIAPRDERKLFVRTDGRIRTVLVKKGDWVKSGQLLVELEMTDLLHQIAQARITLDQAKRRMEEAQGDPLAIAEAESKLAISQYTLQQAESQDPSASVSVAKAELDKAALALEEAKLNDQVNSRKEPSHQLRDAMLSYQIAEARYDQALQDQQSHGYQLSILKEQVKLESLNVQRVKDRKDPQAQADYELADISLQRLEDQASMGRILSPISGQVMSVLAFVGDAAQAFKPIVVVADPLTLEASADLPSTDVIQLHVGQKVLLDLIDNPGKTIEGSIKSLPYLGLSTADKQAGADSSTRISFDPPKSLPLKVGDLARGTVVLEEKKDVLRLPPAAIRIYQGRRFVVVQDGERRQSVDVQIGLQGRDWWEIEGGLQEGQVVVGQ